MMNGLYDDCNAGVIAAFFISMVLILLVVCGTMVVNGLFALVGL
jgi:hypothetical protein